MVRILFFGSIFVFLFVYIVDAVEFLFVVSFENRFGFSFSIVSSFTEFYLVLPSFT